ncbi:hypothetical protein [Streptomyces sp. NPDC101393]|uniref:hypothetical protein n=1 Tax=Streptomyces sp. NPDC101393 TaxID=3366141 RepID=UPI00380CE018
MTSASERHELVEAVRRAFLPRHASLYVSPDTACFPLAEGPVVEECRCQLHFGHLGEEWVLSRGEAGGWGLSRYEVDGGRHGSSARIDLGPVAGSADEVVQALDAALPRARRA